MLDNLYYQKNKFLLNMIKNYVFFVNETHILLLLTVNAPELKCVFQKQHIKLILTQPVTLYY